MRISVRSKNFQTNFANAKRGSQAAPPFCYFCFVVCGAGALLLIMIGQGFASDAHRMRGVISLCFALSPVESYRLFPWQVSSRLLGYAHVLPNARGIQHTKFRSSRLEKKGVETHRVEDSAIVVSQTVISLRKVILRRAIRGAGRGPQKISRS